MAKLIGTNPNQVPTNADLGTTAYTNVQAMPNVVIGEPQEGIRFVDAFDNYALRLNGNDYYSSGAKLSRTGAGTYTGTLQFEKIKTGAAGDAVDGKSGDRLIQIYSSVTNDTGEFCDGPSITGDLLADVGSATQVTGRLNFRPNGGSGVLASIDSDGLKFNGDTSAANAISDYEEGTWTVFEKNGQGGTITTNRANYTKIGRMVYASASVTVGTTTNGNALNFTLPFSSSINGHYLGGGNVSYNTLASTYRDNLRPNIENAADNLFFFYGNNQATLTCAQASTRRIDFFVIYQV